MTAIIIFSALAAIFTNTAYASKNQQLGYLSVPFWAILGAVSYQAAPAGGGWTSWQGWLGFVSIITAMLMVWFSWKIGRKDPEQVEELTEEQIAEGDDEVKKFMD